MLQSTATDILLAGNNVFLTGPAGTGKTHVIKGYISYLRNHGIWPTIVAPTGIAASHIGGMTIHSCFGLGIFDGEPNHSYLTKALAKQGVEKRLENMEVLIIDEVSMLSPTLFHVMDRLLQMAKKNEEVFGGIQVVLSGDFFQLPPVMRGGGMRQYVWQDDLWDSLGLYICYLQKSFRQNDDALLDLLNEIRKDEVSEGSMDHLRRRYKRTPEGDFVVTRLYTHNADIDRINAEELQKLSGEKFSFNSEGSGKKDRVEKIIKNSLMQDPLDLKKGASVMFIKNSPDGRFINGTLGTVVGFESETNYPIVQTKNLTIIASPMDWNELDESGNAVATVSQVPLRLAWAITIHKSQGMTLDAAEIDLSKTFEVGQGYVALSRLRSFSGLKLMGMNSVALKTAPELIEADIQMQRSSDECEEEFEMMGDEAMRVARKTHLIDHGGYLEAIPFEAKQLTKKQKAPKEKKEPTAEVTRKLLMEKLSLHEIAKKREIKVSTVIDHLRSIRFSDTEMDLSHIEPDKSIVDSVSRAITYLSANGDAQSQSENGFVRKKAIYNYLKGECSYDEISLALVFVE